MKDVLSAILGRFGFSLVRTERFEELARRERDMAAIASVPDDMRYKVVTTLPLSRAQLQQDVFVLCQSGFKADGFFVEFGATDGVGLSNTFLLETAFGWTGIVAEPGRCWHEALRANRRCAIDTACVWAATGERLAFAEFPDDPELSTIARFKHADGHGGSRSNPSRAYEVDTLSLMDLLAKHDAPRVIDYLSVDTEGSEFAILDAFDFDAYDVRLITVEHNFTPMREKIHALLRRHGYDRRFAGLSRWDDWYVKAR